MLPERHKVGRTKGAKVQGSLIRDVEGESTDLAPQNCGEVTLVADGCSIGDMVTQVGRATEYTALAVRGHEALVGGPPTNSGRPSEVKRTVQKRLSRIIQEGAGPLAAIGNDSGQTRQRRWPCKRHHRTRQRQH